MSTNNVSFTLFLRQKYLLQTRNHTKFLLIFFSFIITICYKTAMQLQLDLLPAI